MLKKLYGLILLVGVGFSAYVSYDTHMEMINLFKMQGSTNDSVRSNTAVMLRGYHYMVGHDPNLTGPILNCPECYEIWESEGENRVNRLPDPMTNDNVKIKPRDLGHEDLH